MTFDTIARYRLARAAALQHTEASFITNLPDRSIILTEIDGHAISAWKAAWKGHANRRVAWDWSAERRAWQTTLSRFEVAVWSGSTLCGLAIGAPSKGKEHLTIGLLEGAPDPKHPLKGEVLLCLIEAALSYAAGLGCKELRLDRPLPAVVSRYQRMGFKLAGQGSSRPYCWMEV